MLSATANDDSGYMTVHDQPLTESAPGVLNNDTADTDSDGIPLPMTPSLVSGPGNGSVTLNSDGSFVYTPNAGFVGADTFTYNIPGSNTATVTINVLNNAPSASDDSYGDTNLPPIIVAPAISDIDDEAEVGASIVTIVATDDMDFIADSVAFSIDDPSGTFGIDSSTGEITIVNKDNWMSSGSYPVTIHANDGVNDATLDITLRTMPGVFAIISPTPGDLIQDNAPVKVLVRKPANDAVYAIIVTLYKKNNNGEWVQQAQQISAPAENQRKTRGVFDFGVQDVGDYKVVLKTDTGFHGPKSVEFKVVP